MTILCLSVWNPIKHKITQTQHGHEMRNDVRNKLLSRCVCQILKSINSLSPKNKCVNYSCNPENVDTVHIWWNGAIGDQSKASCLISTNMRIVWELYGSADFLRDCLPLYYHWQLKTQQRLRSQDCVGWIHNPNQSLLLEIANDAYCTNTYNISIWLPLTDLLCHKYNTSFKLLNTIYFTLNMC